MIPVTKLLRAALVVHGAYFLAYAVLFEFFLHPVAHLFGLEAPGSTLGLVATGVASGVLATVAALLLLASREVEIPRWVLAVPVTQCSLGLFHDFVWLSRGYLPIPLLFDTILIAALLAVYFRTYKRALDAIAPHKFDARKLTGEED